MIHNLDELLFRDQIAIHADAFQDRADRVSAPSTVPDPQHLEQLLRQDCRDLITSSYDAFHAAVLENPLGTVYEVHKQQAITALKEELRAKAAAATSAEERQIYLNYARVAHLQFAQKTKSLDAVVASYNQNVPEPQHYLCSTTGYGPSSSGVCSGLAALGMGLLGMANRRIEKKKAKNGVTGLHSSPTIVPPEPLSVAYTHGQALPPVDDADGVIVDEPDAVISNGFDVREDRPYIDHSALSRQAKGEEDNVFVEWDDPPTSPGRKAPAAVSSATFVPDAESTEEVLELVGVSKASQLPPDSPAVGYAAIDALAAEQRNPPRRSILETFAYSAIALTATAAVGLLIYSALPSSHPDTSSKQEVVASYTSPAPSVSPPESLQDSVPTPEKSSEITYSPAVAPAYDAQNPAPWYQIEKADLRNDERTLDLRLGPHLSMEGRTVRVTYDTDNDGKADRVKYVDSEESLSLTVSGKIIDVGVGFIKEGQPGFEYHSSVRFDSKNAV